MKQLWDAADFVRRVRRQLRFGTLSRAPLRLLRLELRGDKAECEWMVRAPDPWDCDLPIAVAQQNQTLQALGDALLVRELLFDMLPDTHTAKFRVYRPAAGASAKLIITGTVTREDRPPLRVASEAMRAKLCGLHFRLEDGVLEPLLIEERNLKFAT